MVPRTWQLAGLYPVCGGAMRSVLLLVEGTARTGETHSMHGANDVVDGVEQAWVVGKNTVDVIARPWPPEPFGVETTASPRSADTANC